MSVAEPVITEIFQVTYRFYQYNTGAADNGTYSMTKTVPNAEDAMFLAFRINQAAAKKMPPFDAADLENELIPAPGYFIDASAFRVVTQSYALEPAAIPAFRPSRD